MLPVRKVCTALGNVKVSSISGSHKGSSLVHSNSLRALHKPSKHGKARPRCRDDNGICMPNRTAQEMDSE
jgi:hypothetical protein